ncbi:MAG: hypothetical protein M3O67_05020 [Bacteroidota bacterium]|nr:hypothetical protein [Bacteroidota bacterium]
MLKLGELKSGDIVQVEEEGLMKEGTVVDISREEKQALIDNGVQEFWYDLDKIYPLPLDDEQLIKLGFEKQQNGNTVKYLKGPFRIVIENGNFSDIEMWYREDKRHFNTHIGVHHLQNVYLEMTKVHLEKP